VFLDKINAYKQSTFCEETTENATNFTQLRTKFNKILFQLTNADNYFNEIEITSVNADDKK
jgi:hypothetical protein